MINKYKFQGVFAQQSDSHTVVSFPAKAKDIFKIAKIDRAGRTEQGELFGFQRPQVSNHILEIRDYLINRMRFSLILLFWPLLIMSR